MFGETFVSNGAVADPCSETLLTFDCVLLSTIGSVDGADDDDTTASELFRRYLSGACDLGYVFVLH